MALENQVLLEQLELLTSRTSTATAADHATPTPAPKPKDDLQEINGAISIDGVETDQYTFELDYYWMMGDNRHRSADSRMWGFVPSTHVVGRASFVWFSKQNEAQHGESKIRWNRMFKSVK